MAWSPEDIPDLRGKAILITGANTGVGFEAARQLAPKGPRLLLACRNRDRGREAVARIAEAEPEAKVELVQLDLADLASVRAAAERVRESAPVLDVLVNNAGLMAPPEQRTADGFEMQLGVNHLGHFAFTGLLLPSLIASEAGRVVTLSSPAHHMGAIDFEDLQWERGYDRWRAYGRSKLANLLFCFELQRRLQVAHPNVISLACHPGYAATQLQTEAARAKGGPVRWFLQVGTALFAHPAKSGARPTVHAVSAPGLVGAEYFGPGFPRSSAVPRLKRPSARARDEAVARELWRVSEDLTGVRYLSDSSP